MKNKIIIILLLTLTAFFPNKGLVYADSSAPIREGTETVLTETQRSEISDWAKNSKIDLEELYERIKNLNPVATRDKLKAEVEAIVNTSAPRSTETLMRYSLNRALMINNDIIEKSVNTNRPGVVDQQVRLFFRSIELSLKYYKSDMAAITNPNPKITSNLTNLPFARFGLENAELLMSINESLLDARAQYEIGRTVLAFFANDLKKDQNWVSYAPAIDRIAQFLKRTQYGPNLSTPQILADMRELRRVYFKARNLIEVAIYRNEALSADNQRQEKKRLESERIAAQERQPCRDVIGKNYPVGRRCTIADRILERVKILTQSQNAKLKPFEYFGDDNESWRVCMNGNGNNHDCSFGEIYVNLGGQLPFVNNSVDARNICRSLNAKVISGADDNYMFDLNLFEFLKWKDSKKEYFIELGSKYLYTKNVSKEINLNFDRFAHVICHIPIYDTF